MENKNAHANADSKLEAVQNSRVIREATEKSIQLSKSIFRKDSQTVSKVVQAKELQESKRVEQCKEWQGLGLQHLLGATSLEFFEWLLVPIKVAALDFMTYFSLNKLRHCHKIFYLFFT
jgi:hypothetical protein